MASKRISYSDRKKLSDFAANLYEVILDPHQRVWLDSMMTSNKFFCLASRQIGKSMVAAYAAILCAAGYGDIPAHDVMIISKDRATAMIMIKACNLHLECIEMVAKIDHDIEGGNQRVVLKNGKVIQSFSGDEASLRGFTGTVIIDELEANKSDHEKLFSQALAVSSSRDYYKVIVLTNAGVRNGFTDRFLHSEYYEEARTFWAIHVTSISDVYGENLPQKYREIKASSTGRDWMKEYECVFTDGSESAFDSEQVARCINNPFFSDFAGYRVMGIDVGLKVNPTGVTVADVGGGKCKIIHQELWFARHTDDQVKDVLALVAELGIHRIVIDKGGIGLPIYQSLCRKLGEDRIVGTQFNTSSRQTWFNIMQRLVHDGSIQLGNNSMMVDDLNALGIDEFGKLIVPQRSHNGFKIHCDLYESLSCIMPYVAEKASTTGKGREERQKMQKRMQDNLRTVWGDSNRYYG